MAHSLRGIHRERRPIALGDAAWITDGNIGIYLVESRYKSDGYQPAWDTLEWADPSSAPKKYAVTSISNEAPVVAPRRR